MRILNVLFLIIWLVLSTAAIAQKRAKALPKPPKDTLAMVDTIAQFAYAKPWITNNAPEQKIGKKFDKKNNDQNFFLAVGLLFIFGLLKLVFGKYIKELWILSFKSSFRTSSLKAQLSSNKTASLAMNLFFCITSGTFLFFVLQWQHIKIVNSSWLQLTICISSIMLLYTIKYFVINLLGAVFQQKNQMEDYLFIVFLSNKLIGLVLLPIICLLLINNVYQRPIIIVTLLILSMFFIYRYLISYTSIARRMEMQKLHFFIYLCSVEILPLLLLSKLIVKL